MTLVCTPSQTVGPFSSLGFEWCTASADKTHGGAPGITVHGIILDGEQVAVTDAVLEFWQADPDGIYRDRFSRVATDQEGRFVLHTLKPGIVHDPVGARHAPHLVVTIFMRGLLRQLLTRLYFDDEAANAHDPVLTLVPAPRRATLIARSEAQSSGRYGWDLYLQGPHETVFFDC